MVMIFFIMTIVIAIIFVLMIIIIIRIFVVALTFHVGCRVAETYEQFHKIVDELDPASDLKWWSQNHGIDMAMVWPQFEVGLHLHSLLTY